MRRLTLSIALGLAALAAPARAARPPRSEAAEAARDVQRVPVSVTAVAGREVFLDRGREAGLAPDDRVELELAGEGTVEARVRVVSRNSARATLAVGAPDVPVGTRGVVLVPAERLRPAAPPEQAPPPPAAPPSAAPPGPPEHPPWTQPPEEWSQDTPLLAPVSGVSEDEREIDVHGRVWAQIVWNEDSLRERSWQQYRAGAALDANNPFGRGGGIRFSAQALQRDSDLGALGDDSQSEYWLDRFSYWEGGTQDHPDRFEVGRFLQKEFSELGLLDGVEYSHRTSWGDRIGASFGYMPEPFPGMPTGDDLQAALTYRAFLGEEERLSIGGALQGTWHEGEQDRTLLLASVEWTPEPGSWLRSIAFVDWYGSDDGPKASGPELTDLQVQGGLGSPGEWGLSASFRQRRWPYLLRNEIQPISAAEVADARVEQAWVSGWIAAGSALTFNARLGWWQDQDNDGGDAELGASWNRPWEGGRIDAAVLVSEGSFSSIKPGLRASVAQSWSKASAVLSWTASELEQQGFFGEQSKLLQQTLRGSFDWRFAPGWNATVGAQKLFGDELDGWIADFRIQRSF